MIHFYLTVLIFSYLFSVLRVARQSRLMKRHRVSVSGGAEDTRSKILGDLISEKKYFKNGKVEQRLVSVQSFHKKKPPVTVASFGFELDAEVVMGRAEL